MTAGDQMVAVFAGVSMVLMLASVVGYVLQRADCANPTIDNLNRRIKAWLWMIALLGTAFAVGKPGVIVLFALASLAAFREFITLAPTRRGDHMALAVAFFVVLPLQYYFIWLDWYGLYSVFIPVYVFVLLASIAALRQDSKHFMSRVAETQWGLMTTVFALSHVPALLGLQIPAYEGRNLLLVAFLVLVVESSDVLQYVWGKLLGRHKLVPALSPSKTVEGLVGGVASASILGALLFRLTPFPAWQAGMIALLINILGVFGGLVMSALKRDRGVKDWGWAIEGHGGVLDRLDSLIFAAPVFFHLTRYWWAV